MRTGYPVHVSLDTFLNVYKPLKEAFKIMLETTYTEQNDFVKKCLLSLGLTFQDFKIGTQYIFSRANKSDVFDQLFSSDPQIVQTLIKKTKKFLVRSKWQQYVAAISINSFLRKCK